MMKVTFKEECNTVISDVCTLSQRGGIWSSDFSELNNQADTEIDDDQLVGADPNAKARRHRIRSFTRFIVGEYKSLKAMGVDDTISLYHVSAACSKVDAVRARERAANENVIAAKSSCCSSLLRKRHCSSKKRTTPENTSILISSATS